MLYISLCCRNGRQIALGKQFDIRAWPSEVVPRRRSILYPNTHPWQTPAPIFPRHIQTAIISPSITKWKSRICSSHAGKSPFSLVTTIPTAHKRLVVYTLFGRSLDAQLPKVESSMLKLQSLLKMLHQIRSMFNAIGVCLVMFQIMPMLTC